MSEGYERCIREGKCWGRQLRGTDLFLARREYYGEDKRYQELLNNQEQIDEQLRELFATPEFKEYMRREMALIRSKGINNEKLRKSDRYWQLRRLSCSHYIYYYVQQVDDWNHSYYECSCLGCDDTERFNIMLTNTYQNEMILNLNQPCALTREEASKYYIEQMAEYEHGFFEGSRSMEEYDPETQAREIFNTLNNPELAAKLREPVKHLVR